MLHYTHEHVPGDFLGSMQQLLVSPNTPYHQDFELPLAQPVYNKIKNNVG